MKEQFKCQLLGCISLIVGLLIFLNFNVEVVLLSSMIITSLIFTLIWLYEKYIIKKLGATNERN